MALLRSFTRYIALQDLSDLDFDLSRSLRVKCDSVIGFPMYAFLLILIVSYGLTVLLYKASKSE